MAKPQSVLVVIPHFYNAGGSGQYGSTRANEAVRAEALRNCIVSLWRALGGRAALLDIALRQATPGPPRRRLSIQVMTTGERHLIPKLNLPDGVYQHRPVVVADPMYLGFEGHRLLAEGLGEHDWFAFLEDDLLLHDPLLLDKLAWFSGLFGQDKLLHLNRYEDRLGGPVSRLYVDGPLRPHVAARFRAPGDPVLAAEFLGRPLRFEPALNPHSGCFFLSKAQMARWAAEPHFLDRSPDLIGPLESAASLGVLKTFAVYKTAAACSDFVEIEHAARGFIGMVGGKIPLAPGLTSEPA